MKHENPYKKNGGMLAKFRKHVIQIGKPTTKFQLKQLIHAATSASKIGLNRSAASRYVPEQFVFPKSRTYSTSTSGAKNPDFKKQPNRAVTGLSAFNEFYSSKIIERAKLFGVSIGDSQNQTVLNLLFHHIPETIKRRENINVKINEIYKYFGYDEGTRGGVQEILKQLYIAGTNINNSISRLKNLLQVIGIVCGYFYISETKSVFCTLTPSDLEDYKIKLEGVEKREQEVKRKEEEVKSREEEVATREEEVATREEEVGQREALIEKYKFIFDQLASIEEYVKEIDSLIDFLKSEIIEFLKTVDPSILENFENDVFEDSEDGVLDVSEIKALGSMEEVDGGRRNKRTKKRKSKRRSKQSKKSKTLRRRRYNK